MAALAASLVAVAPAAAQSVAPPATATALGFTVPMTAGPTASAAPRLAVAPGGVVQIQDDGSASGFGAWPPPSSSWHAWVSRSDAPRVPVPDGDPLLVTPAEANGTYDVTLPPALPYGVDRLTFSSAWGDRVNAVAIVPLVRFVWVTSSNTKVTARLAVGGAATVGVRWRRGPHHSRRAVVQKTAAGMATVVLRPSTRTRRRLGVRWADRSRVVVEATTPAGGTMTETVGLRPR